MLGERSESLRFNYHDLFFSYYLKDEKSCTQMIREHLLTYVYSGEMIVEDNGRKIEVRKGECIFLRRDNRVNMNKQPYGGEPFQGVFIFFRRNFLREFYQTLDKKKLPLNTERQQPSAIKLPKTPDIKSLFESLNPYFDANKVPSKELIKLKLQEGIFALLNIDTQFFPALFDFTEPWKIDILDFLDENYMFDLSIEDIAGFTGRSLATFKRDFKKISDLSPERWLIDKRLKVAHDKIRNEKRRVSDVYLEVGFKNLSHFSVAYKKQYGVAPSLEN